MQSYDLNQNGQALGLSVLIISTDQAIADKSRALRRGWIAVLKCNLAFRLS